MLYTVKPRAIENIVGRSAARCTDDLMKVVGSGWMRAAQDQDSWRSFGETFVQNGDRLILNEVLQLVKDKLQLSTNCKLGHTHTANFQKNLP